MILDLLNIRIMIQIGLNVVFENLRSSEKFDEERLQKISDSNQLRTNSQTLHDVSLCRVGGTNLSRMKTLNSPNNLGQ